MDGGGRPRWLGIGRQNAARRIRRVPGSDAPRADHARVAACTLGLKTGSATRASRFAAALAVARAFVDDWLHLFDFVAAHDRSFTDAKDAVEEHRMPFRDAMLWAAARHAGCTAILTERMPDGWRLNGVFIVSPFAADSEERLATLVGV